jgi:hypothetical protein
MNNIISASDLFRVAKPETFVIPAVLRHFIGRSQMACLRDALKGEEAEAFREILTRLAATVETMPKSYETDGQGNAAVAHLHYFTGSCDWYITERDMGCADDAKPGQQLQAFGLAKIHEEELGYISIAEIIANGAELDFYFTPKPLSEIREDDEPEETPAAPVNLAAQYPQLTPVAGSGKSGLVIGAANLRKLLKEAFPTVKISVRSESFAGGNAISVHWTDGPTSSQVEALCSDFKQGYFNGMDDSYEYNRSSFVDTFGGAKYVSASRSISPEAMRQVAAELGHDPAKVDVIRMELPCHSGDWDGRHASEAYRAAVYARDFTAPALVKVEETKTAPKVQQIETLAESVTVTENPAKNGVEIRFPSKPQSFLLDSLKALGWRWSRVGACWYHRRSDEAIAFARNLAATFTHA